MKNVFIKTILVGAFLFFVVVYYAKYGQSSPIIYNEVNSAEDYYIEKYIEEEEYEQQKVDTVMVKIRRERKI